MTFWKMKLVRLTLLGSNLLFLKAYNAHGHPLAPIKRISYMVVWFKRTPNLLVS